MDDIFCSNVVLPIEIWHYIMRQNVIDLKDIIAFSETCKLFRHMIDVTILKKFEDQFCYVYRQIKKSEYWRTLIDPVVQEKYLEIDDNPSLMKKELIQQYYLDLDNAMFRDNFLVIKNKTEKINLIAIKEDYKLLQYVKQPSKKIYLAAAKNHTDALLYIYKQTHELCLIAVRYTGLALKHVKEQNCVICLAAVNNTGLALEFVEKQTKDICFAAVKQNKRAIKYVKDNSIVIELMKYDGMLLKYVDKQTNAICLAAIKQNISALRYVRNWTQNIVAHLRYFD